MVRTKLCVRLAALLLACAAGGLGAAPLDPAAFTSLGTLNLGSGTYTVNTTAMTLTGPSTSFTGVASGNICVFCFASVNIQSGAVLNCTGTRTLAFLSQGSMTIEGTINCNGETAQGTFVGTNYIGGPGGGNGGLAGSSGTTSGAGSGPGGGMPAINHGGAGGGGFGTAGARGGDGISPADPGQNGGPAYGDLSALLQGGSGGGGGWLRGGGGGGGGLELGASGDITILRAGVLSARGGDGEVANQGASGGGSGGGIFVHTPGTLTFGGLIDVRGGGGGKGG
ncbi:MAG: hypothetical protein KJ044_09765 [Planctomycetes bacterium]|nr:hypothetical protein [Planctomycetota bacterium]